MDSIQNLRTFIAVAESASLVGAGRRLGVVASVVTKRIDQLEWRVRAPLFTRSTRRVALTALGSRHLPAARRLIHDYDELIAGMSRVPQHIEGHVRIRIPTSMAPAFMADLLSKFQQQFPLVSLDVVLTERPVNPDEEGFDIAISALPVSFPGVVDEAICPLHRLVCAAPAYLERRGVPRYPSELAQHDCLVFMAVGPVWTFESAKGQVSVELQSKMTANDSLVLTSAAINGNGIAVLPTYAARQHVRAGTLVRVLDGFSVPSVWIKALVPERRVNIPRVRSLIAFLKAHLFPVPPWDIEG